MVSSSGTILICLFFHFLTGLELPPSGRNCVIIVTMGDCIKRETAHLKYFRRHFHVTNANKLLHLPGKQLCCLSNNDCLVDLFRYFSSVYFWETKTWTDWNIAIVLITIIGRRIAGFRNSALLLLGAKEPLPSDSFCLQSWINRRNTNLTICKIN